MKILGITGGVGAGKSTVLAYLAQRYGAYVIQADEVGRLLQTPGHSCYEQIAVQFGPEILGPDGAILRDRLAALVFADAGLLEKLNAIVHPAVKAYIIEEIALRQKQYPQTPFIVLEAALLLEDHYDAVCDEIWYIYASNAVRIRRLAQSRGYSEEKSASIIASQLPEAEYRRKCKTVIDNSSEFMENTYEQIDKGLREHGFL